MSVMVKNKTNKNYKRSQKGRSMVEMLGVLAIVGVLSVGGVYGYGVAMKKHKANELLHQASMQASSIAAQIASGKTDLALENFGNSSYGTFSEIAQPNDEQFEMKITGMDPAVCEQMEKMAGGMVRQAECSETTLTLTYNNNLSSDKVATDYNGDEPGCESSGRKYCDNDTCIPSSEECPTGGSGNSNKGNAGATEDEEGAICDGGGGECSVCLKTHEDETSGALYDSDALCPREGEICLQGACVPSVENEPSNLCKCILDEYSGALSCGGNGYFSHSCSTDSDCEKFATWDAVQEKCVGKFCTKNSDCTSDEYCLYSIIDTSSCVPQQKGTCMPKSDSKGSFSSGVTAEKEGFIVSSGVMDWYSAQNFCRSYNKNLVTLSQVGLEDVVPYGEAYCNGYHTCQISEEKWKEIQDRFRTEYGSFWTANLIDNGWDNCSVFVPLLSQTEPGIIDGSRYMETYGIAMCR